MSKTLTLDDNTSEISTLEEDNIFEKHIKSNDKPGTNYALSPRIYPTMEHILKIIIDKPVYSFSSIGSNGFFETVILYKNSENNIYMFIVDPDSIREFFFIK